MPIRRFSHLGICVSDLEASVSFYRDKLGFEEASRLAVAGEPTDSLLGLEGVELQAVYLERDGVCIELLYFAHPPAREAAHDGPINRLGLTHLSLRVTELPELLLRLEKAGVQIDTATRIDNPALASSAVFLRDPDGTRIELFDAPGDVDRPPGG